jgi:hypothetical protein
MFYSNFNEPSLYTVEISKKIGKEYVPLCDDISRMIMIQLTIQFMLYLSNPNSTQYWSSEFVLLLLFIVLGVSLYWLVFRTLIKFA